MGQCPIIALEEQTLEGSETEEVSQNANCQLLAQHQTGETPLGQLNRKLYALLWIFSRASWIDKGEMFDVEGQGCVEVNVGVLVMKVLITPVRLTRYDQLQLLQPHLSSF